MPGKSLEGVCPSLPFKLQTCCKRQTVPLAVEGPSGSQDSDQLPNPAPETCTGHVDGKPRALSGLRSLGHP